MKIGLRLVFGVDSANSKINSGRSIAPKTVEMRMKESAGRMA
jgi:hypothetical protein